MSGDELFEAVKEGRRALDRYYTPDPVALHLAQLVPAAPTWRVADLQVGGGAWIRAVRELGHTGPVTVADVDPEARGLDLAYGKDDLRVVSDRADVVADLVIGNPPYNQAEACVRHALEVAPRVAFLLRLSFLGSAGRVALFRERPPVAVYMVSPRPSFTGGGTDSSEYAFIVWDETAAIGTRVDWTEIGKPGAKRAWCKHCFGRGTIDHCNGLAFRPRVCTCTGFDWRASCD